MPSQGFFTSKIAKKNNVFESRQHQTRKIEANWFLSHSKQESFFAQHCKRKSERLGEASASARISRKGGL